MGIKVGVEVGVEVGIRVGSGADGRGTKVVSAACKIKREVTGTAAENITSGVRVGGAEQVKTAETAEMGAVGMLEGGTEALDLPLRGASLRGRVLVCCIFLIQY